MRIVHLMNGLEIGGRERVVLDLSHRAVEDGHEVELVTFDTPFRSLELDLDPGDLPVQLLARKPGVDVGYIGRLARLLRDRRPAILHAHNDTAVFYGGLAARRAGVRCIGTFHTRPSVSSWRGRLATRLAGALADRLTAVSGELATWLVDEGWAGSVETLMNGVAPAPPSGEDWRRRLGIGEQTPFVGHVGRFVEVKRQLDLLDAQRELRRRGIAAHLVLVGQGPELARVRARVADAGDVSFVAHTHDVTGLLSELDVFVLCSSHECASIALLEAMSQGVACVATDVGGTPELLQDAGVLVPPARPDLLAGAVARLLGDEARRRTLGELAKRRASEFTLDAAWKRYAALYARVTNTSPDSLRAS